jgi:hypothetical protein
MITRAAINPWKRLPLLVRSDNFGDPPYPSFTDLPGFFPHPRKRCVCAKLRNRLGKISVQRVGAFLPNFSRFWRMLVAIAAIQPRFFHLIYLRSLLTLLAAFEAALTFSGKHRIGLSVNHQ